MQVIESIKDLKERLGQLDASSLGFVPTMGALHEGHLSLIRQSLKDNRHTVVSIFVNPTQFDDQDDFSNYPVTMVEDLMRLEPLKVDLVFTPTVEAIYPRGSDISVEPGSVANLMCGMSRPGHFRGVLTVVLKLFNLVGPRIAYFGQKDYQQFLLISKMTEALNLPVDLRMMPTFREKDGLAMSSRNVRLSQNERRDAPALYKALSLGERMIADGEESPMKVIERAMSFLIENTGFEVDYLSLVNPFTLEDLETVDRDSPFLLAGAAFLGKVRLIDNILHVPGRSR